jgi:hypothetical protein
VIDAAARLELRGRHLDNRDVRIREVQMREYSTQKPWKLEVVAACDVPQIERYVSFVESRVDQMLRKGTLPFGDLQLTVTLARIRTRTTIDTRQVLVDLEVDANFNGVRLNKEFSGKYFESGEGSIAGCLAVFLGPFGLIIALAQYLAQSFVIDDVPPEWIAQALDNCLVDLGVALDRLLERESENVAFFNSLNRLSWLAPLFFAVPCAVWLAIRESNAAAVVVGIIVLAATFLTVRLLRTLLLPASFWIEESLGQKILRGYGVSTVWGARLVSLICITGIGAVICVTFRFIFD